ncbi:VENN motif pre-toxin domain-containing protein [Pantoea sp. Fr+CA_20]|uniref:VENN motif pre-toxin domain-containing protein n=1 Tax=Pantoea sp. Fr+CA_20 TaxID=2929506 RepID=UPI0021190498|nr:VENN motif pre-toxin domain-containing protein [Pantoea sp. Fr+CA_20]
MAHALLGGVVAELSGGSAAAGATGAVTGELAAPAIALVLYGTADSDKLSPDQKANLSALATLASGIAAGVSSGSTAGAATGALAGKNAVENNALTGLENFGSGFWKNVQAQGALVNNTNLTDENGKVLNPATSEEIKYASDKLVTGQLPAGQNAATGLLTAWGAGASTVVAPVLLPATATAGSVIGAGAIGGAANVFNQLNSGEPFSATDALIATGISGVTQGKGFWFTEAASVTGAYAGAKLQDKDVIPTVAGAAIGTVFGATGSKAVEVGNKYIPIVSDKTAGIAASIGGSVVSEVTGSRVEDKLKDGKNKK